MYNILVIGSGHRGRKNVLGYCGQEMQEGEKTESREFKKSRARLLKSLHTCGDNLWRKL